MQLNYNPDIKRFIFDCTYHQKDIAKEAGCKWDPKAKQWWTTEVFTISMLTGYHAPDLQKHIDNLKKQKASAIEGSYAANKDIDIPAPLDLHYLPYQKAGIYYASQRDNCLIADEMGLGKTIQAIGLINHSNLKVSLIICPASLKNNWKRELDKWIINRSLNIEIIDKKTDFSEVNILIISYEGVRKYKEDLDAIDWELMICDESHYLKNSSSMRCKSILGYRGIKSQHKLFLTGTPILNKPIELWPIVKACGLFTNWKHYVEKYCGYKKLPWGYDFSGASNTEELGRTLRENIMIRRLKKDVLKELPTKVKQLIILEPNSATKNLVKTEKDGLEKYIIDRRESKATLNELRRGGIFDGEEYKNATATLKLTVVAFNEIAKVRLQTALAKVDQATDYILSALDQIDHVVVFAHHREVIRQIEEKLIAKNISVGVLTGATKIETRQNIVDDFQNGLYRVFLGSIKAAGVGLTLTRASNVIFVELDWVPANVEQATDRCIAKGALVFCLLSVYNYKMSLMKIEKIKIGDMVLSHEGHMRQVMNINSKEHRGMVTIIKYVGWYEPLECTYDHKIFIKRNEKNQWIKAHELLPSDSMAFPKLKNHKKINSLVIIDKWRIYRNISYGNICKIAKCNKKIEARNMCREHYRQWLKENSDKNERQPRQFNPRYKKLPDSINITKDWLYLFGWYLAEGFSSVKKNKGAFVSLSGHEKEINILKKLGDLISTDLNINYSIYKSKKTKAIELRAYSTELALWFGDWFGDGCESKKIPIALQNIPVEQAKYLLRGYTDGDGYRRRTQVEWVSISKDLCYQMCLLSITCGFIPTMRKVLHPKSNRYHYIGCYTENGNPSNKRLCEQDDVYIYRPITSVETRSDKKMVYDLTIDKDHSFTSGFCSVHNCHRIGQKDSVHAHYLVYDGTLDANIAKTMIDKEEIIEEILR